MFVSAQEGKVHKQHLPQAFPNDKATFSSCQCCSILGILRQTTSNVAAPAANMWAVDWVKSDTWVILWKNIGESEALDIFHQRATQCVWKVAANVQRLARIPKLSWVRVKETKHSSHFSHEQWEVVKSLSAETVNDCLSTRFFRESLIVFWQALTGAAAFEVARAWSTKKEQDSE